MDRLSTNLRIANRIASFFKFAALSGLGWGLDFSIYLLLVNFINISPSFANFISAIVATTIVYFVSLRKIFNCEPTGRLNFLFIYWTYQFLSIVVYSALLHPIISYLTVIEVPFLKDATVAKIIVTPFNLITNYLFMSILVKFINQRREKK